MQTITKIIIVLLIILLIIGAGFAYWYFLMKPVDQNPIDENGDNIFSPLNTNNSTNNSSNNQTNTNPQTDGPTTVATPSKIPKLRLLSNTPVGGYGASTTDTTTVVRWIDRGRGNIYETAGNSSEIITLSNTLLPKIYGSTWNKGIKSFIGWGADNTNTEVLYVYADMIKASTSTSTSTATSTKTNVEMAPYELKVKGMPRDIISVAVSPKKDKVFLLGDSGNGSVGLIANFDGTQVTQIFTSAAKEFVADWPTDTVITLTTKGSADLNGYMYSINPKTGSWTKLLGPTRGLGAKMSKDGKYIAYSKPANKSTSLNIYNISKSTTTETYLDTLVDKCVWGNFYKDLIYCAVPFEVTSATYPDEWYKGKVGSADKIWQLNASTGESKLVEKLIGNAGRIIDGWNLGLDDKDNFLFFVNKWDLSLWSLDLEKTGN